MTNLVSYEIMKRYNNAITRPIVEQLERTPGTHSYIVRHQQAWTNPRIGFEKSIVNGIESLANMAMAHESCYGSKIADDGVLGDYFASMARGVRGMLNGEIGRLDGGFCDGAICNIWAEAGFTEEL